MEQEAKRLGVGPLEIIQQQEQRVVMGQGLENLGDLIEQVLLLEGRLAPSERVPLDQALQGSDPRFGGLRMRPDALQ